MFDQRSAAVRQIDLRASLRLASIATLLGLMTAPVFAAPSVQVPCKESTEITLHVSDSTLASQFVNHDEASISIEVSVSSSTLLAPRAEAAIREAFSADRDEALTHSEPELAKAILALPVAGAEAEPEQTTEVEDTGDPDPAMNAKLPGISDDELSRYKKQMYRRDI